MSGLRPGIENQACAVVRFEATKQGSNGTADGAMAGDQDHTRTGVSRSGGGARVPEPAPSDAPWLPQHNVKLPDPIEGYVRRPEVEERCARTGHRVTVLHASFGSGKTALLAPPCRFRSSATCCPNGRSG